MRSLDGLRWLVWSLWRVGWRCMRFGWWGGGGGGGGDGVGFQVRILPLYISIFHERVYEASRGCSYNPCFVACEKSRLAINDVRSFIMHLFLGKSVY